jgi:hypothetical protein
MDESPGNQPRSTESHHNISRSLNALFSRDSDWLNQQMTLANSMGDAKTRTETNYETYTTFPNEVIKMFVGHDGIRYFNSFMHFDSMLMFRTSSSLPTASLQDQANLAQPTLQKGSTPDMDLLVKLVDVFQAFDLPDDHLDKEGAFFTAFTNIFHDIQDEVFNFYVAKFYSELSGISDSCSRMSPNIKFSIGEIMSRIEAIKAKDVTKDEYLSQVALTISEYSTDSNPLFMSKYDEKMHNLIYSCYFPYFIILHMKSVYSKDASLSNMLILVPVFYMTYIFMVSTLGMFVPKDNATLQEKIDSIKTGVSQAITNMDHFLLSSGEYNYAEFLKKTNEAASKNKQLSKTMQTNVHEFEKYKSFLLSYATNEMTIRQKVKNSVFWWRLTLGLTIAWTILATLAFLAIMFLSGVMGNELLDFVRPSLLIMCVTGIVAVICIAFYNLVKKFLS